MPNGQLSYVFISWMILLGALARRSEEDGSQGKIGSSGANWTQYNTDNERNARQFTFYNHNEPSESVTVPGYRLQSFTSEIAKAGGQVVEARNCQRELEMSSCQLDATASCKAWRGATDCVRSYDMQSGSYGTKCKCVVGYCRVKHLLERSTVGKTDYNLCRAVPGHCPTKLNDGTHCEDDKPCSNDGITCITQEELVPKWAQNYKDATFGQTE